MFRKRSQDPKKNGSLYPFVLMVLAGSVTGSVLVMLYPEHSLWMNQTFCQGMSLEDMPLLRLAGYGCLSIALLAAFGLSVLGGFGSMAVVFCKGMALGAVLAKLYSGHALSGILTSALFIIPYGLGSAVILMLAARESCNGAHWLMCTLIGSESEAFPLKRFAIRFWILAVLQFCLTAAQYVLIHFGYAAFLRLITK